MIGSGTSYHTGLSAKNYLEEILNMKVMLIFGATLLIIGLIKSKSQKDRLIFKSKKSMGCIEYFMLL